MILKNYWVSIMLLAVVALSCNNDTPTCENNKQTIFLLDTIFQSGTTTDEFQSRYSYINTTEIQNTANPPVGNCEGYGMARITANYKHHNINGELILRFFNNALCSVSFVPQDSSAYLKVLCERSALCMDSKTELYYKKALVRRTNLADKGFAVVWEDECIMQKLNDFIKRCS